MVTIPSAATRASALLALLPSLIRRISSALALSPSASVRAFLHSIIGASVLSRSSLTIPAVISAIFAPKYSKKGALAPWLQLNHSLTLQQPRCPLQPRQTHHH